MFYSGLKDYGSFSQRGHGTGFFSPGMGFGPAHAKIFCSILTKNFCWPEPSDEFYTPIMISGGSVLL